MCMSRVLSNVAYNSLYFSFGGTPLRCTGNSVASRSVFKFFLESTGLSIIRKRDFAAEVERTRGDCLVGSFSLKGEDSISTSATPQNPSIDSMEPRPPGVSTSFYKRELPSPPSVAFSSATGQEIFQDAMRHGMLRGFFSLIEQFRTQDEPAFCGLASVAMVLNSLSIDPRRPWKGPWRIFHEQMLDCCIPLETVQKEGITLSQAACLTRCNGAGAEIFPYGSVSLEEFRGMIETACSTNEYHLIVSYSRKHFLQTGDGHFSPIGGYSPTHDAALILDTARFKYPPHWVPVPMLYDAMEYIDPTTNKSRGFMKVSATPILQSVLFALDVRDSWEDAHHFITTTMPEILSGHADEDKSASALMNILLHLCVSIPEDVLHQFMATRSSNPACNGGACVQQDAVNTLLAEMTLFPLYTELVAFSTKNTGNDNMKFENEKRFMFILMCQEVIWESLQGKGWSKEQVARLFDTAQHKVVDHEVKYLKEQYKALLTQFSS
ncbi:hypothetical protein M9435_006925 [Picochlorum sp. BPE23]|nr:hypothetical protein M9435_006925 [Picochlorum sp. BPE23]